MPTTPPSDAREESHFERVARRVLRRHTETGASAVQLSRIFRSTSLPVEMRTAAARRFGTVALIIAITFITFFLIFFASGRLLVDDVRLVNLYDNPAINAVPPLVVTISIIFSLIVYFLSRKGRTRPETLLNIGVVYQLAVALELSLLTHLPTWEGVQHSRMWSGVAIWIIIFAVLVPNTPRRVLIISTGAALMDPIGLLITHALGAALPAFNVITMILTPTFMSVGLALACSIMIHRLGREVEQARQMGSYELEELLGKGGMGEVWQARHRSLARPAAIKLIRGEALADGDSDSHATMVGRFEREAQTTATLESAHTVTLHDFGVASDGSFYYVMELLRGMDLEHLIGRFGPISPERLVYFLIQVCHSLEEAHSRGLVHRDIKPANIFISRKGLDDDFVKVLDFGLVKRDPGSSLGDVGATALTAEGSVTGTPDYMAPEMISSDTMDARADIYGLGCVAYFALCGETIFGVDKPLKILLKHVNEKPDPISSRCRQPIPQALEMLIHGCLEKDPEDRPSSAGELRERLMAIRFEETWTEASAKAWWASHAPGSDAVQSDLDGFTAEADTLPGASLLDSTE